MQRKLINQLVIEPIPKQQENQKVQAPSLVETFPNIKQQFEIDVDATCVTLISKNILFFIFQFLEKGFFNTMFETVKII